MARRSRLHGPEMEAAKAPAPSAVKRTETPIAYGLLAAGFAFVALRLWTSFCFFPLPEWNAVRLAPSFMLRFGPTPYPGLTGGPLTTWIYGPMPLLIDLPATLAHDSVAALVIAGVINLLANVVPVAVVVLGTRELAAAVSPVDRVWALLLCLALWPNPSLQYIQADNIALAFGLLSNFLLGRGRTPTRSGLLAAGLAAAMAVWSKQTSIGLVVAQIVWRGWVDGPKAAWRHGLVCAACCAGLGGIFVARFGFEGLWLNLVRIPAHLPYGPDMVGRTRAFWMQLAGYVVLPAWGLMAGRRAIWKRDAPWLLPALTWVCLLPTGLVAIYKIGGATNSLNGVLYLLPPAALAAVTRLRRISPRTARAWLAAGIAAVVIQQMAFSALLPMRPLTTHLRQAEYLAARLPGRIYFPWHPLVTFFTDHRFYHAEDGLYTRHVAHLDPSPALALKDLPPLWSVSAFPGWRDEGRFKRLQPPSARRSFFGKWTLYSWPSSASPQRSAAVESESP